jgi:hypothetical protein
MELWCSRGINASLIQASIVLLLILGLHDMAHAQYAQYVRSCGKVSPLTPQGTTQTMNPLEQRPYTGNRLFEFIPSLCVSERYDSNVFYAPKTPGLDRADFVTDVNPQVRVNHNGDYLTGYLDVGGFYESYVRNSDLNFFGTADSLFLNLDNSIKRYLPNGSLIISDSLRYTPTPPGFSNVLAGTSPGAPVNIQNIYAQGILSYRTNNVTNGLNVLASYKATPLTTVSVSYMNMILRFGSSPITSGALLFDTTTHTGSVGAGTQLTALDTLNVNYSHTQSDFTPHVTSGTFPSSEFKTDTATLGWSRNWTPYLTTTLGGGGIVIDPGLTTYALNASMIVNTPNNIATISYARSAFPSFVGVGAPVISDIFSLSAIQKLGLNWELDETASYMHGSGGSGSTAITYDSYLAAIDLYYWITKMWSTALSFDYMNFQQEFGTSQATFDRYAVTLSVKATWN